MLIHSVFFWLEKNLVDSKRDEFLKGLEALKGIEEVDHIYIGAPGPTDRPAVDRTYDFGLTVLMKNMDVHDAYQKHSLHKEFLGKFASYWSKVVIYDHQS